MGGKWDLELWLVGLTRRGCGQARLVFGTVFRPWVAPQLALGGTPPPRHAHATGMRFGPILHPHPLKSNFRVLWGAPPVNLHPQGPCGAKMASSEGQAGLFIAWHAACTSENPCAIMPCRKPCLKACAIAYTCPCHMPDETRNVPMRGLDMVKACNFLQARRNMHAKTCAHASMRLG